MTSTVTRAAEAITSSILLAAVTRIGVPLLLAGMLWLLGSVVNGDKRVSLIEARLAAVETRVAEDSKSSAQMRSDISALLATSAATLRAVERLERLQERPAR